MKNTQSKRQLTERRQVWVDEIKDKLNYQVILAGFAERGLATQSQLEKLSSLTTKQVRIAVDDFLKGKPDASSLLRSATVNLQGQRGRPQTVYLLTEDGAAVLKAIHTDLNPPVSQINDDVELAHALMEVEVYTLACEAKRGCSTEHVLSFGERQYVRADVLVESSDEVKIIFEMEQTARAGDVVRIHGKLDQYVAFFQSEKHKDVSRDVRILFNLASNDSMTIKRWGMILEDLTKQYGDLPFHLYWLPVLDFLQKPRLNDVDGYLKLEAASTKEFLPEPNSQGQTLAVSGGNNKSNAMTSQNDLTPPFLNEHEPTDLHSLSLILHALSLQTQSQYATKAWPYKNRASFFDLMRTIYLVSHYRGGPVFKDATMPVHSLVLLYRYLNMHQNSALLQLMLKARDELRKSQNRGINLYRDAYSRMCWEFLRYHGFGRHGPLNVFVRVPPLSGDDSEMFVEVKIRDQELVIGEDGIYLMNDLEYAESALSWVLSAFWIYGEELGLTGKKGMDGKSGITKME